jgi:hypothetical protein
MTFNPSTVSVIAYADSCLLPAGMPWALKQASLSMVDKRQHQSVTRTVETQQEVRHR